MLACQLKGEGYTNVQVSPGSRGAYDVRGTLGNRIEFHSVRANGALSNEEQERLIKIASDEGGIPVFTSIDDAGVGYDVESVRLDTGEIIRHEHWRF